MLGAFLQLDVASEPPQKKNMLGEMEFTRKYFKDKTVTLILLEKQLAMARKEGNLVDCNKLNLLLLLLIFLLPLSVRNTSTLWGSNYWMSSIIIHGAARSISMIVSDGIPTTVDRTQNLVPGCFAAL